MLRCAHCGKPHGQSVGLVNRAAKIGAPLYCDRKCAGLARRVHKSKAQKVEEKRLYDAEYRARNLEMLKAKKRLYFQRTYDPRKAALERAKRMPQHVEYCRRPVYKAWKSQYDTKYRAQKQFGPFWETALTLSDLEAEIASRSTRYEIMLANGTINKAFTRRRTYESQTGRTFRH